MTDEEKAAAALAAQKAAQEAKNKSNKGKSEEGDEEDEPEDEEDDEPSEDPKLAKLQSQLKKAREDAAKRRIENKELKTKQEKTDKALAALNGEGSKEKDPVEELKKSSEAKLKRSLLKGELAVVAKDAHNIGVILSSFGKSFEDVEVDVDGETVDTEQLTEKVNELRESHPYLFKKADEEVSLEEDDEKEKKDDKKKKGGTLPPDRGGKPKGGTNHKDIWQKLLKNNQKAEAQKYYVEHKSDILARM